MNSYEREEHEKKSKERKELGGLDELCVKYCKTTKECVAPTPEECAYYIHFLGREFKNKYT